MKTYSKNCKTRKPDGMEKKKKPQKKAMGGMTGMGMSSKPKGPMGMKEGGEVPPMPRPRPKDLQAGAPSRTDDKEPAQAKLQRQIRDLQVASGFSEERARNIIMEENNGAPIDDKKFGTMIDFYKEIQGKMYGGMAKKKMAKGGKLKMVEKDGKKVPFYAADGKGKMMYGGMAKKKA
jgi:hypothetical protein